MPSLPPLDEWRFMDHPVRVENGNDPLTQERREPDRPAEPAPSAGFGRPVRALLALACVVLFAALPVRLYLALTATMVSRDGVTFIWYAQGLERDPLATLRDQDQHPLYPALVLGAHELLQAGKSAAARMLPSAGPALDDPVRSWTLAAMSVTFIGGLAVIVAVYALAARLFDRGVGLLAAAMAALAAEYCQLSADALTDMPHLTLYLFALYAGLRGIQAARSGASVWPRTWTWFAGAGVLSGLAFLMRPEGGEAGLVCAAGAIVLARGWHPRRRLAAAACVALGAAAVASPYMVVTGKLVQKKSIGQLLGQTANVDGPGKGAAAGVPTSRVMADAQQVTSFPVGFTLSTAGTKAGRYRACDELHLAGAGTEAIRVFKAGGLVLEHWGQALRVTLLLPAIAWLVLRRERPAEAAGRRLVAAAILLHVAVVLRLILQFHYEEMFSVRHVMILAGLTLPFSAAGLAAILDRLPERRRSAAAALILLGLVAPTLPWMLEPRFAHEAYLRQAGEWIRTRQPAGAKILTTRHRVAFYANGAWIWSTLDANHSWILGEARLHKADWLVFDEQRMLRMSKTFFDDLENLAAPGELERTAVFEQPTRRGVQRAIIYRHRSPSP